MYYDSISDEKLQIANFKLQIHLSKHHLIEVWQLYFLKC